MRSSLCTHRAITKQTSWCVHGSSAFFHFWPFCILRCLACTEVFNVGPQASSLQTPQSRQLGLHGAVCCAQGRPVYIQHIGAIKIKQLQEITTEDRMVRFHIQVHE